MKLAFTSTLLKTIFIPKPASRVVCRHLSSVKNSRLIKTSIPPMEVRPGLKTVKIDNEAFRSLLTPELMLLSDLFEKKNFQLRMAGGAVRDLLMDITPADIDFASDATPSDMKAMFEEEGIRTINKNGETHGTITCRINDKENFEVTTLRIDVVCNGRRAEVTFTTNWELDAFRRDLTINSLFLGIDGTVYDYTGGIEDIKNKKVRFVGNAVARIQEDYLRILRYFRFFGRISKNPTDHDEETLIAIKDNKEGMRQLSGERLWTELKRIVIGRFAGNVMRTMLEDCKLHSFIGLDQDASDVDEFCRVYDRAVEAGNGKADVESCTVLSAFFRNEQDVMNFHKKCKISNHEKFLCLFIVAHRKNAAENLKNLKYFQDLILDEQYLNGLNDIETTRNRVIELLKYVDAYELIPEIKSWEVPKLPVTGIDLKDAGVPGGRHMKVLLQHFYLLWRKSDYTLNVDDLLKHKDDPVQVPDAKGPKAKKQRLS